MTRKVNGYWGFDPYKNSKEVARRERAIELQMAADNITRGQDILNATPEARAIASWKSGQSKSRIKKKAAVSLPKLEFLTKDIN